MECKYCGDEFIPRRKNNAYCSKRCKDNASKERRGIKPVTVKIKTCPKCGVEFETVYDSKIYCDAHQKKRLGSKPKPVHWGDCWHYVEGHALIAKEKHKDFIYLESRRVSRNVKRVRLKCKHCGSINDRAESTFREKNIVCECCGAKAPALRKERVELMRFFIALKEKRTPKVCPCCRETFYSEYADKVYCSDKCKRKEHRRRNKKAHPEKIRARKYIDRTIKYGGVYEYGITLPRVYKKFQGVCQICGEPCDMNDRSWGNSGPCYPSVDHIVPLSKGGSHTWGNVQLAHLICNSIKCDTVAE